MAAKGQHELVGLTIEDVVPLEHDILIAEGWDADDFVPAVMLVLSDGTKVYPAAPWKSPIGALYGVTPDGEHVHYQVEDEPDDGR